MTTAVQKGRTRLPVAMLAVLCVAMLATVVAADMVNLMLPAIGAQFGASEAEQAWVVTGFLLVFSVGIPFYGRLADRVRLRRLFTIALVAYAVGGVVCALAPGLVVLVAGRVVMGAGAAGIPVLAILAVSRYLAPERRGTGIGVVSAASGVGTAAGPAFGGGVGQFLGWPTLFWTMAGLAVVLLVLVGRVLPDAPATGTGRFDLAGGVLLGAGAGLVLYAVTRAQVAGFGTPGSWGSLVAGVGALALCGWRTARTRDPFVPPQLFANRVFRVAVAIAFLAMAVDNAALVFVPAVLVTLHGLAPGTGALVMIPAGLLVAAVSPYSGRVVDRVGARRPVLAGLAGLVASAVFLSVLASGSVVAVAFGIAGVCTGLIFVMTPIIAATVAALPETQAGIGLGVLQGAQFLGAGAGPALGGVLIGARTASEGAAGAYSDAFLAMAAVALVALPVALWMRAPRLARAGNEPAS